MKLPFSERSWYRFFGLFAFVYLSIHLATLSISPLPWFDETYMASIANEFIETGQLFPRVAQVRQFDQELIYGPVYFAITGIFIKLFGLNAFAFRLTTLIAGFLVIWRSSQLLKLLKASKKWQILFILCLSLDPFLNRSMHEGRMDLLALFFVLTASLHFIRFHHSKQMVQVVWAAFWCTLTLLTTPRTGFLLTAWALLWSYWLIQSWKTYLKPAVICLTIVLLCYSCWILYAFGSLTAMLEYYSQYLMFTRLNLAKTSIMKQQYLLILLGAGSAVFGLIRFGKSYLKLPVILAILSVICFYALVFDQGPYAVFIVPSYYLMVFGVFVNLK